MNVKPKPKPLIVEFKQFQRLPDWAIIKLSHPARPSENAGEKKLHSPCPPVSLYCAPIASQNDRPLQSF